MTGRRAHLLALATGLVTSAVVYAVGLAPAEAVLTARGHGIVAFELARIAANVDAMVADWGAEGVSAARASLLWDLAFIPGYVLVLWGAARLLDTAPARRAATWAPVARCSTSSRTSPCSGRSTIPTTVRGRHLWRGSARC